MELGKVEAMADQVSAAMGAYVERAFAGLSKKVAELQAKLDALPVPKDGRDGIDGKDGQGVDLNALNTFLLESIEMQMKALTIPAGKDGDKGESGKDAVVDYDRVIAECVKLMPPPEKGERGKDGADAISIPGTDGQDGQDGEQGRDALEIEVLDGIDVARSYPRGTYATHNGGLIRANRKTDPSRDSLADAGWSVIVDGIAEVNIVQGGDLRTFAMGIATCGGKTFVQKFTMPVILDRGVFQAGAAYAKGDAVSWYGSLWIAQADIEKTSERPGQPEWRLSVKHGRDGKNFDDPSPRNLEVVRLK